MYAILTDGTAATSRTYQSPVELVIEETDPSIKGASASARTKPARLVHWPYCSSVLEYIAPATKLLRTQLNVNT